MVAVLNGIHESKQAKKRISPAQIQRIEYKWGCRSDPHLYSFLKNNQHSSKPGGFAPPIYPQQEPAPCTPW